MRRVYGAGADLAFRSDFASLVIVSKDEEDRYDVAAFEERRPEKGKPLVPSKVCRSFAEVLSSFGLKSVGVDGHYVESARELFAETGIMIDDEPGKPSAKVPGYLALRELVNEARIRIAHPHLLNQLKTIKKRPLPGGGLEIKAPRKKRSGHGDGVSALVLAVWMARETPINAGRSYLSSDVDSRWGSDRDNGGWGSGSGLRGGMGRGF